MPEMAQEVEHVVGSGQRVVFRPEGVRQEVEGSREEWIGWARESATRRLVVGAQPPEVVQRWVRRRGWTSGVRGEICWAAVRRGRRKRAAEAVGNILNRR
jgi:hypothetical protein